MKSRIRSNSSTVVTVLSVFILALTLIIPCESSAFSARGSEKLVSAQTEFNWCGYDLVFTSAKVIVAEPLDDGASPTRDVTTYKKDRAILTWNVARNRSGIDGYVILRRTTETDPFTEIARVGKRTDRYVDRTVKNGKKAFYTLVGYIQNGDGMRISACCGSELFPGKRVYQNPEGYVEIRDRISTHGYNYYTSPVLVNSRSTREDHIEAMILTACRYLGDSYENRCSTRPGEGLDCSGLIMQAAYGAGVDLWPSNPYRHRYGDDRYEWESREIGHMNSLKTVPYSKRKRGDLIFYTHGDDVITHVALYLGNDMVIHSYKKGVGVTEIDYNSDTSPYLVKRIFN